MKSDLGSRGTGDGKIYLTEFEFFGKPWENQAIYDSLSPIRKVHRVKTPTLIVQSEEDHRTPMGNAEVWFMALKKQGVPTKLIIYEGMPHSISGHWNQVHRAMHELRWWETYLKPAKPLTQEEES